MKFENRKQAGELLAKKLASRFSGEAICIGLARGGVIVASSLASGIDCPLDVLSVKKIPCPMQEELALGAITLDGTRIIHWATAQKNGVDEAYINHVIEKLAPQVEKQMRAYRKGKSPLIVKGKTVILVDDGIATGATIEVAITWCKKKKAKKIFLAIPVVSPAVLNKLEPEVDEAVVLYADPQLNSVGQYYNHFEQVTDEEVIRALHEKALNLQR